MFQNLKSINNIKYFMFQNQNTTYIDVHQKHMQVDSKAALLTKEQVMNIKSYL